MLIIHSSPQLMAINFESPFQQVLQQQRPLLRSFNKAKKWQLWLSERPMLKRSWVNIIGLDQQKVIHLTNLNNEHLISTIEKALKNKTCSYVVACINHLNDQDKQRIQQAASTSDTCLLLVQDDQPIQYH
ncbi:SulA-like leucine-rich domain-containing protein [uncultured Gilliamella sp.]|uniref:cell division inhibitor SulA n=1 Tax=uncultured Gilliamella sp. TaxID=1193505 RepID=UPI0025EAEBB6|nr:SulA-like leucine-rich domain-containing protein [uncultured Gilliamella sp.]